ncbi:MAG TPA: ferrochelatase [Mycobacteriales bacterium]|nr:ferrochelatase [Mycobacteriales bacterium]
MSTVSHGPYDAFLLVSFGGPEGPEEVLPFLENVTRGRGVPAERLLEVAEHYKHFAGISPINAQNRTLLDAIRADFAGHGLDLPLYWGNRNWHPLLAGTVERMRADGVRRAVALVTSAYSSYSGCRQYHEDIDRARAQVGPGAPEIDKLRHYFNHPGFVRANADAVIAALATLPEAARADARLVFTAHSVPVAMARASGPLALEAARTGSPTPDGGLYVAQLTEAARLVTELVGGALPRTDAGFDLVWQSRSGPPRVPWLEPDVNDHIEALAAGGTGAVVVSPIGFVSDHVEVRWDLDTEAAVTARRLGLGFARAATAGTHPDFVTMVRELVDEVAVGAPARALGPMGPSHRHCPAGCCPSPRRPANAATRGTPAPGD